MEFEVLYNLDFDPFRWHVLLIPMCLIFLSVNAIKLIKRYGFNHPMQTLGFFPNLNFTMIGKFFAFIIAFFGFIILIVMLVQIPIELIERRKVKEIIKNNYYKTIEGRIESFSPAYNRDQPNESFEISGVKFSYSEFDDIYGYSKTSIHGGIIDSTGQYLRISYYFMDGQNIICKIEGNKIH